VQFDFLYNEFLPDIKTEGVRYTGSKKYLIPYILDEVKKLNVKKILDGFSGTTRVAQALKLSGYNVDTNDLTEYSKVFGYCYLINNYTEKFYEEYIEYLNSLEGVEGYFTKYYSADGKNSIGLDGKKKNWHRNNALKIDAVREEIENITNNYIEKCVLLTSLLLAADKVSNNLGHQVSYLRNWASRSLEPLILRVPKLIINKKGSYNVYKKDIMDIKGNYDLSYIDPPYNTNNKITTTTRVRYASYYHIWTTLCKNDKPKLIGAANRREEVASDSNPKAVSDYESTNYDHVFTTFKNLFKSLNTKYIIMSYSNKGKITVRDLEQYISKTYNLINIRKIEHKENVQRILTTNKNWLGDESDYFEYLFVFEK